MLLSLLLIPLLAYALAVGAVYIRQEALLFFPEPLASNHRFPHAGVEERYIDVDGAVLHALHRRLLCRGDGTHRLDRIADEPVATLREGVDLAAQRSLERRCPCIDGVDVRTERRRYARPRSEPLHAERARPTARIATRDDVRRRRL